ncbi:Uncharacterised protein [Vibrio cholerae]|nr:Uncharacterised protein [Vibrio cholerae]
MARYLKSFLILNRISSNSPRVSSHNTPRKLPSRIHNSGFRKPKLA